MLNKFAETGGLCKDDYPSLHRMRIPAIGVSAILIVFEHTFAILRACFVTGISFSIYMTAMLYLVLAVCVGLYFTITGIRVLRMISSITATSKVIRRVNYNNNNK